jgi:hypothetical protein
LERATSKPMLSLSSSASCPCLENYWTLKADVARLVGAALMLLSSRMEEYASMSRDEALCLQRTAPGPISSQPQR